ncbi:putative 60S ribosomal protein L34-like [Capsicum annuum]|nr:putative 60S ribosomal protein L34-like [Capsicum annuum]
MATDSKLSLKLLIDPKAKKVLFAETEKDCVDFLFHILSLPVSTVIRLLKTKGMNYGCLPNLYESVENLHDTYIQSNQGKDILLKPKTPVGIYSVPFLALNDEAVASTGTGFVKEAVKYMVMDDLVVEPISVVSSITALNKYFNVKDALKLLKASFESKTVLTSVFMSNANRRRAL